MRDLLAALAYFIPEIVGNLCARFRQRTDQPHCHQIEKQQIQRAIAFEEIVDLRSGSGRSEKIKQRMVRGRVFLTEVTKFLNDIAGVKRRCRESEPFFFHPKPFCLDVASDPAEQGMELVFCRRR